MSAGSPRQLRSHTRNKLGQTVVSPQQVTDPSILDSVAGFINEVATYNVPFDTKDQIQWVRFESFNCDAILENEDGDSLIPIAIVLILGYTTGIQVWAIPANGEAIELLSWRHGTVRVLKFLPTPYKIGCSVLKDAYAHNRPLIALCDTTTPGPHYSALSFISLKTGEQVKVIKFKNPILDVLANQHSVVVTFGERIAVFDAFTLEDQLTVTTCYLSPGLYPNPVALGTRWLAYAERKLVSNKRSSGGNEGESVQSYTATVIHAAKTLGKGLRELGETVASSLTGTSTYKPGSPVSLHSGGNSPPEAVQKGVVTILDIENRNTDDGFVAHFAAHSEAIVCLAFDPSGMLLLTADKRGHDFHLFRIHPHPAGSALAAVHHLYVLHRGDTTARVQDVCFSPDSRWVAVSTLRGTTHVFPVTPYGGNVGYRTHGTPFVVNRMSRFHRSAGLPAEGRSNSPVSLFEAPANSSVPYNNPRLAPYPHPTIIHPLAQIRQPLFIQVAGNLQHRPHAVIGRPRLNSSSEDNIQVALRISTCFASSRAWFDNLTPTHELVSKHQAKPLESLFIMSCHGNLIQYDLDPHQSTCISKEKKCSDESPIELAIQAKAQWTLQRQSHWTDTALPINAHNLNFLPVSFKKHKCSKPNHMDDRWLSQVEIVTHAGPHRRLWMGPQFTFKTYTTNGSPLSYEGQAVEVGHSKPVNMPSSTAYPILIESGSTSSCEQSPKLLDTYHKFSEIVGVAGELQLKEDLADAMLESPGLRETEPMGKEIKMNSENYLKSINNENVECINIADFESIKVKADTKIQSKSDSKHQFKDEIKIETNSSLFMPKKVKSEVDKKDKDTKINADVVDAKSDLLNIFNTIETNIVPPILITTPDLMDTIDDFPFSTDVCTLSTEPVTYSNEYTKEDYFEDATDTPEITVKTDPQIQDIFHDVESEEIISLFDEGKNTKKARKPKTKLGVRLSSRTVDSIDKIEKENESVSVQITLPAPRKTWSSIVASKPIDEPNLDFPELKHVETNVISYSMMTKKLLTETDTLNDACLSDRINKGIDIKLSDDEKQGNCSSQNETTESDDSISKVLVMDTEADKIQPDSNDIKQNEKIVKRKSKRKKK